MLYIFLVAETRVSRWHKHLTLPHPATVIIILINGKRHPRSLSNPTSSRSSTISVEACASLSPPQKIILVFNLY